MIDKAKTIIFDCDGVILNSNQVKKNAYYKIVSSYYGDQHAQSLIDYLSRNTGKPREHFFNHFLTNIIPSDLSGPGAEELLDEVAKEIHQGLMSCEISQSLFLLRDKFPDSLWLVVSGGVETELKSVFQKRSLFDLFDGGIFGGPSNKDEILKFLIQENIFKPPVLFLGDSKYDYEVSNRFNFNFRFVSDWTGFQGWKDYCYSNKISSIKSLDDLL